MGSPASKSSTALLTASTFKLLSIFASCRKSKAKHQQLDEEPSLHDPEGLPFVTSLYVDGKIVAVRPGENVSNVTALLPSGTQQSSQIQQQPKTVLKEADSANLLVPEDTLKSSPTGTSNYLNLPWETNSRPPSKPSYGGRSIGRSIGAFSITARQHSTARVESHSSSRSARLKAKRIFSTDITSYEDEFNITPPNIRGYIANFPYEPCECDELIITPGDLLLVEVAFPDNWAWAYNSATGMSGMAPLSLMSVVDKTASDLMRSMSLYDGMLSSSPVDKFEVQPSDGSTFDVMISCHWTNRQQAVTIADYLRERGLSVWMDKFSLGRDIFSLLGQAILSSKVVVPLLSAKYERSESSMKELLFAGFKHKTIISLRLDSGPFHESVSLTAGTNQHDLAACGSGEPRKKVLLSFYADILSSLPRATAMPWPTPEIDSTIESSVVLQPDQLEDNLEDLFQWFQPIDMNSVVQDLKHKRLPKTRKALLEEFVEWSEEEKPEDSRIFIVHGAAGMGKSVLASVFAVKLQRWHRLAAIFVCKSAHVCHYDPFKIIATWAFQLASFDPRMRDALRRLLKEEPNFLQRRSLARQFEHLIVRPLKQHDSRNGTIVVVLDGLGCGPKDSKLRTDFLNILNAQWKNLPPSVLLFITTRHEEDISTRFACYLPRVLELRPTDNHHDLRIYVLDHVTKLRNRLSGPETMKMLVDRLITLSRGSFLWIVLALDEIDKSESDEPFEALEQIEQEAQGNDIERLDALYTRSLANAHKGVGIVQMDLYRRIVGTVLCLKEPMGLEGISGLLKLPISRVRSALSRIQSLIGITDLSVQITDGELVEYLTSCRSRNSELARRFYIDLEDSECAVATTCVAALVDLYLLIQAPMTVQDKVKYLSGKSLNIVPYQLEYSCRNWASHLDVLTILDKDLSADLKHVCDLWGPALLFVAIQKGLAGSTSWILKTCGGPELLKVATETMFYSNPIVWEATKMGFAGVVEALILYGGADVNTHIPERGQYLSNLLHMSVRSRNLDVVRVLLRNGANMDERFNNLGLANAFADVLTIIGEERQSRLDLVEIAKMDEIHRVCRDGDIYRVARLVSSNYKRLQRPHPITKKVPLHYASEAGHHEIVQELLESGADANIIDAIYWSGLHYASRNGHLKAVQILIEHGANVNSRGKSEWKGPLFKHWSATPLCLASEYGRKDIVQYLLDKGAIVQPDDNLWSPLMYAAVGGHLDIARVLIQGGAQVNVVSSVVFSPLLLAAHYNRYEMISFLLEQGANVEMGRVAPTPLLVESTDPVNMPRVSPLYWASGDGDSRTMKLLLDHKANVNFVNYNSIGPVSAWYQAIHRAAVWDSEEAITELCRKGAVVNHLGKSSAEMYEGLHAMHLAALNGGIHATRTLLDLGADIEARSYQGETPLIVAARALHSCMCRFLTIRGANVNATGPQGDTVLHVAARKAAGAETIRILLELEANPLALNNRGETALHVACRLGHLGVVKLLLPFGGIRIRNSRDQSVFDVA
ncbi:hypothetical protein SmJEL517_g01648 [Synchytrium microbalum]|uniref:SH3 domain-containing protein n=1 Tax=Synchytrium microbalum TaxID=1806994 RepID=A0A507CAS3_9FUNG|nr:uncharacterized protein SmJEL517_g01648 [Synchytrium microbalum]TPX36279.1 hypothetical protein SmJEL517_g01648 [Synchytrium microbalum]